MTTAPTWYEALEFAARHLSSDWPEHCQQIVRMARAALAQKDHEKLAPQQAEAVPPGYVLVPVEPNRNMLHAMHTESLCFYEDEQREAYLAMLAAAPKSHQSPKPSPNEWVLE